MSDQEVWGEKAMSEGTRNSELLADFTAYCNAHPQERFWQALRNWSNAAFIAVSVDQKTYEDTFHREGRYQ